MTPQNALANLSTVAVIVFACTASQADDWKGWMGDQRDGVYRESGVIDEITPNGLTVKWRNSVGSGYAGPAVAEDCVVVFDYIKSSGESFNDPGKRATLRGRERIQVFEANSGKLKWSYQYDCPYSISYPAGPRCTPTIDDGKIYSLGAEGDLKCIGLQDGKLIWERSLKESFGIEAPIWGFASHPLVVNNLLYTSVGGKGQGVVALDKLTGQVVWKSLDAKTSYSPITLISAGDTEQLICFHPQAVSSLNPQNGELYWEVPITPDYEMSIASPVVEGNHMYISSIRTEAIMLKLNSASPTVKEIWRGEPKNAVHCANSTPLFVDGIVFGTDCNDGDLVAVDSKDGTQLWTSFEPTKPGETRYIRHGTAFITRRGDSNQYFLMSESGDFIVAELSADGYLEKGRFHVLEPTAECFGRSVVWSHPAYAQKTLFVRNDKEIVAVNLAKE